MKLVLDIFIPVARKPGQRGPVRPLPERKRQRWIKSFGRPGARTDEPDQKAFKQHVANFVAAIVTEATKYPVRLVLTFVSERPKSLPKRPTTKYPTPWAWITKPDATNMAKLAEDAVNGIVFADDSQVVDLVVHKRFGKPGVHIAAFELHNIHELMPMQTQEEAHDD